MLNNPELIKNLKLEFSSTRIVIPLVILALMSWLIWASTTSLPSGPLDDPNVSKAKNLYMWLCAYGYFFTITWGGYLSANSIVDEVRQKTWDFVRLSSLPPTQIIIGKLFGSNFTIWLVTLGALIPSMLYCASIMIPNQFPHIQEPQTLALFAVTLVLWGLFSQTATLFIGISQLNDTKKRPSAFALLFPPMLIGLWIGASIINSFDNYYEVYNIYPDTKSYIPKDAYIADQAYMMAIKTIKWYSLEFSPLALIATLLAIAFAWCMIGSYRLLRSKLLYKDAPWVWIVFILSTAALCSGFREIGPSGTIYISLLAWVPLVSTMLICISILEEARQTVRYRACYAFMRAKNYKEAFRIIPLWIISFAFLIIGSLTLVPTTTTPVVTLLLTLSYIGFVCRDILMIHAISWSPKVRRPVVGIALYFALVYGILPPILKIITSNNDAARYLYPAARSFHNMEQGLNYLNTSPLYWAALMAQIAVAAWLFYRKWDKPLSGNAPAHPA